MSTSNTIENQKVKNTDSFTPFYIPDPPYDKVRNNLILTITYMG